MIVKNEAKWLERCLQSALPHVQEIIIVDTGSDDDTKQIAKKYTNHVYDFTWTHSFSSARNEALKYATKEWILVLDADETIDVFPDNLIETMKSQLFLGTIEITSPYLSKGKESLSKAHIPRLFPRGHFFEGDIHEQVVSNLPIFRSGIQVFHNGYEQSKAYRNIPMLLKAISDSPESTYFHYQLAREYYGDHALDSALSHFKFCYDHMTKQEQYYPTATVAYLYALLDTQRLEKALTIISENEHILQGFPDFHFFCGLFYTDYILSNIDRFGDRLHLIENSYLRCLEIGENHRYNSVHGTGSILAAHNLSVFYELLGEHEKAKVYKNLF